MTAGQTPDACCVVLDATRSGPLRREGEACRQDSMAEATSSLPGPPAEPADAFTTLLGDPVLRAPWEPGPTDTAALGVPTGGWSPYRRLVERVVPRRPRVGIPIHADSRARAEACEPIFSSIGGTGLGELGGRIDRLAGLSEGGRQWPT